MRYIYIFKTVTGCPELIRPANAWYKREGNEALIGCEKSNEEWRLTCKGNKWIGEVGNCTETGNTIFIRCIKRVNSNYLCYIP